MKLGFVQFVIGVPYVIVIIQKENHIPMRA